MSIRRATQIVVTFPLIDSANRPARKSGVVLAAGQVKVSKDGGPFADATSVPAEVSAGRYALTLTAAEMDAAWVHVYVEATGCDPWEQQIGTSGDPAGAVQADAGNSALAFKTDLTATASSHWKDALVVFTSGALAGQVKKCSAYDGATKFLTVSSSFTTPPSVGDRFRLLND